MSGIPCPYCGIRAIEVMETRPRGGEVRRRRWCADCHRTFPTVEVPELVPEGWQMARRTHLYPAEETRWQEGRREGKW